MTVVVAIVRNIIDVASMASFYRQDAADTLIYCYNVLNRDLFILLGQRLSQSHNDVTRWTEVESTIHAFKALCDNVGNHEFHYVAAIMDLMLQIPYGIYPREVSLLFVISAQVDL
jgi:hypothetical protein